MVCANDCPLLHQMTMMSFQQQTQQHALFYYHYLVLQCKIGNDSGARKAEEECWRLVSSGCGSRVVNEMSVILVMSTQ
jgi:hypothetical protein